MNFEESYGEVGKQFIHVHHIDPVASKTGEYEIDPQKDLIPVCPNCHAMIHKKTPPYSVEELKQLLMT
jgi:5-methylcytosine-specific restriction protein A